ncbi:hypothetical protein EDB98_112170 [Pseudomonas fluorescens]|nr:hypothetical protein EDB98_112170 [Pseudomonas fluorescens]
MLLPKESLGMVFVQQKKELLQFKKKHKKQQKSV